MALEGRSIDLSVLKAASKHCSDLKAKYSWLHVRIVLGPDYFLVEGARIDFPERNRPQRNFMVDYREVSDSQSPNRLQSYLDKVAQDLYKFGDYATR